MVRSGRTDQTVQRMARDLKKASRSSGAPIWSRLAKLALKPTRARRTVNVNRLAGLTKQDDVVVVPGKVLGTGTISHGITLCPFSISAAAAGKIRGAGGRVVGFDEVIQKSPTGRGVALLA